MEFSRKPFLQIGSLNWISLDGHKELHGEWHSMELGVFFRERINNSQVKLIETGECGWCIYRADCKIHWNIHSIGKYLSTHIHHIYYIVMIVIDLHILIKSLQCALNSEWLGTRSLCNELRSSCAHINKHIRTKTCYKISLYIPYTNNNSSVIPPKWLNSVRISSVAIH